MQGVQVGKIYYTVSMDTAQMLRDSQEASQAAAGLGTKLNETAKASSLAELRMTKTAAAVQQLARESQGAQSQLAGLGKILGGLLTLQGISSLIQMAEGYNEMAERIRMATSSQEEYEYVQKRLLETANGTYRSLAEAQELYIRTGDTLRGLGYSTGEAMDIVDSMSYAFVKNATSTDRAQSAISAFTKAMNKGKVEVDAFETIIAATPSILQELSDVLGIPLVEVQKLGFEGKIAARDFAEAWRKSMESNKAAADGMATTVRDAFNNLRNNLTVFIGEANEASGSTAVMSQAILLLGQNIETVVNILMVAGAGAMARYIAQLGAAAIAHGKLTIATRQQALSELALAKQHAATTSAALTHAQANIGLGQAFGAVSVAAKANQAALLGVEIAQKRVATGATLMTGLLGGPAGVVGAVASVAAGLLLVAGSAEKAKPPLIELGDSADTAREKFEKLDASQRQLAMGQAQRDAAAATKELSEATNELSRGLGLGQKIANEWRRENQKTFDELAKGLQDGTISVSEFDAQATAMVNTFADGRRNSDSWRAAMVEWISTANTAAKTAEKKKGIVDALTGAMDALAGSTREAAQAERERLAADGTGGDYLKALEKRTQTLKDGNSEFKKAQRHIAENAAMSEDLKKKILEEAKAHDALAAAKQKSRGKSDAEKASEKEEREREKAKEDAKRYVQNLQQQLDQVGKMNVEKRLQYDIAASVVTLEGDQLKKAMEIAQALDSRSQSEKEREASLNIQNAELSAQRLLLAEIAGYDADIAGMTMGDKAAAEMQKRLQLVQQFAQRIQQIDDQRRSALAGKNAQEQKDINDLYDAVLKIEQDYQQKSLIAFDRYVDRKREKEADWAIGAGKAWANYVEESQNAASQAESAMSSWLSSTEDALVKFVQTGKLSFKDLANSIIADLARIAAKQMITGLLGNLFGSFMGGWSAAGVQSSGAVTAPVSGGSVTGTALPPVSGGRANGGPVGANKMYEVNERGTPELLTYGGKQYLMMGSQSGNVTPMGMGGSGGNVIVQIEVNNHGAQVQQRQETQQLPNGDVMKKFILDVVGQSIAQGQGAPYQGIKGRFNVNERR